MTYRKTLLTFFNGYPLIRKNFEHLIQKRFKQFNYIVFVTFSRKKRIQTRVIEITCFLILFKKIILQTTIFCFPTIRVQNLV